MKRIRKDTILVENNVLFSVEPKEGIMKFHHSIPNGKYDVILIPK